MGIGSISFWQQDQSYWSQNQSFYQQDQNYWSQQQAQDQVSTADDALISSMGTAETNLSNGLSSIANQRALTRVNNQIAADEKTLESTSSSGSGSSGSSSPSGPAPAVATGTVPLTTGTLLSTLGIPPNGVITVSDGTNTTRYSSTGTDTIADLIGAINANVAGNAYVTASLNGSGKLIITGKDDKETVTVGGTFAPDVGFGPGHQTFQPTTGSSSTSAGASSASTPTPSSASSGSAKATSSTSGASSKKTSTSSTTVSSLASENASTAASLLTASGVSGSLVDMLV